jgi:hypothetical protein
MATREQGVTVIALGPEYEHVDDAELENLTGALSNMAVEADQPLVVLTCRAWGTSGPHSLRR